MRIVALVLVGAALASCDPYERRTTKFHAGPVDPVNFPPEYLGTGANRFRSGTGRLTAARAYAADTRIEYFRFSFTPTQLKGNSLAVLLPSTQQNPTGANAAVPVPKAYAFDPTALDPVLSPSLCVTPASYSYDQRRDGINRDEQGNIFTALPEATYVPGVAVSTRYVPIVAEVPVESAGEACQEIQNEEVLLKRSDVKVTLGNPVNNKPSGQTDGRYMAWAVIDPGAAVYHAADLNVDGEPQPATGVGLQKWGWFKRYLLAYLDGGYVPTIDDPSGKLMVPQKIYIPKIYDDGSTAPTPTSIPGALGRGYDVLEAARGAPGYSPVCQVMVYDTGAPLTTANLPKSAATIEATYPGAVPHATIPYVYCLQLK